jgi:hypothetical protein
MSYTLDEININGANLLWIVELDSSLAVVTGLVEATNCLNLGHIKETEQGQSADKTESKSEDGLVRKTEFTYSGMTKATIMQASLINTDYLSNGVKTKTYLEGKKIFVTGAGKAIEMFKIVQVTPQHNIKTPGADASFIYESATIFPSAAISFTAAVLLSIETALSISISATAVTIPATVGFDITNTINV